jgi:hypothetical protein
LTYDPNLWIQAYVPGFGIDSSGHVFDAVGAGDEIAKVLLNPAQEQILLLTGADAA